MSSLNSEQHLPLDESDDDESSLKSYIDAAVYAAVDEITDIINEHIEIQNKNIRGLDEDLKAMRDELSAMSKRMKE
jgi:hypothetical protein